MPTSRRGGGSRRTTKAADRQSSGLDPVFSGGDDNIVEGEVLVTLSATAADSMTESVPLHPVGPAGSRVRTLGVDDLDAVLSEIGAYDIARLSPSRSGMARAGAASFTFGHSVSEDSELSRSFRIRVETDVAEAVAKLDKVRTVEHAEPNRWREATIVPNDPLYPNQWGLPKINAPQAWDVTTGSPAVVVAVVDSGVDLDHPELAPLLVPGFDMVDLGPAPVPPPGWRFEGDFSGRDDTPEDEVGHGTHVAGTIACVSNNGAGVAGVGWQTKIMPVKGLTRMVRISDGRVTGVGSSADIAAAVRWAADHGAHVINMSLGSDSSTLVESSAVAYAISKGVVVVAAMGNDGSSDTHFPAGYPDVVAVGAIDSADHRASFSQTGAHIDVMGPGVDIVSTYLDGGTATLSGTSMATPHVSGVAALIKAAKPAATGAEIADILRTTARALRDNPSDPVPNDSYGFGCVDAKAAVDKANPPVVQPVPTLTTQLTPHLRTSFVWCQPRTVWWWRCIPRTVLEPQCLQVPVTTTIPTTRADHAATDDHPDPDHPDHPDDPDGPGSPGAGRRRRPAGLRPVRGVRRGSRRGRCPAGHLRGRVRGRLRRGSLRTAGSGCPSRGGWRRGTGGGGRPAGVLPDGPVHPADPGAALAGDLVPARVLADPVLPTADRQPQRLPDSDLADGAAHGAADGAADHPAAAHHLRPRRRPVRRVRPLRPVSVRGLTSRVAAHPARAGWGGHAPSGYGRARCARPGRPRCPCPGPGARPVPRASRSGGSNSPTVSGSWSRPGTARVAPTWGWSSSCTG